MPRTARRFVFLLAAGVMAAAVPAPAQRGPSPHGTGLPADVLALACAPSLTFETPPMPLRLAGGQDSFVRRVFGPGDLITINAGTEDGIDVGQEFYVRRVQAPSGRRVTAEAPAVIRTAGWIRVYAVDIEMSLATISHACDTIESGDYLEPFVLPVVATATPDAPPPQRGNYGRILIGADRRTSFGKGDFMIVDRGRNHGVAAGDQFVIYRDKRQAENFLYELGEAVAVDVKPETSTLHVTISRDALTAGDYVALRK